MEKIRQGLIFEKVKKYCEANGITVKEFEVKVGIANAVASHWKDGFPRIDTLQKICEATGTPIDYWITED